MRKSKFLALAAVAGLSLVSSRARATLLAYEGFNYTVGNELVGQNGGVGFGINSWVPVNSGSPYGPTIVSNGSLTFSGNSASAAAGTGNSAFTDMNDRRSRFLDTTESGIFAQNGYIDSNGNVGATGKTLYLSFLQKSGDALPDSFFEFELHRNDLGDGGRIGGIGDDATGNNMNLRTGGINNQSLGTRDLNTNLYVMKIQYNNGNDTVSVYRNPTGTTEPGSSTVSVTNADMSFDGISLAAFIGNQSVTTDEIRIGTTFSDVITGTAVGNPTAQKPDPFRPGYHFTAPNNWLNDPNGLIFANGVYNMYYQIDANSSFDTGSKSWGHAVSTDLVHWTDKPIAIAADNQVKIWSGTTVIDTNNTAGFGAGAMVAAYTGAHASDQSIQDQRIAYSTDGGISFTKYNYAPNGGPVIPADNTSQTRDPAIFWYAPGNTWILADSRNYTNDASKPAGIQIYKSPNLKDWTYASTVAGGGGYECPDMWPMPVNGDPNDIKWVLMVSANGGEDYKIGSFDGTTFTPQQTIHVDYGNNFYAAQQYNNLPGRDVVMAWMISGGESPTGSWHGQMTLPRQLSLKQTNGSYVMVQTPVPELQALRTPIPISLSPSALISSTVDPLAGSQVVGDQLELIGVIDPGTATRFGFEVRKAAGQETIVGYDVAGKFMYINRDHSSSYSVQDSSAQGPLQLQSDGTIKFDIFVDASSVEVFGNDGLLTMSSLIYADPSATGVSLFAEGGNAHLLSFQAYQMADSIRLVPEPGSLSLVGFAAIGMFRRKSRIGNRR